MIFSNITLYFYLSLLLLQGQPNGTAIPLNIARYQKTVSAAVWVQVTLVACYLPYGIVAAIATIYGSSPSLDTDLDIYSNSCLH